MKRLLLLIIFILQNLYVSAGNKDEIMIRQMLAAQVTEWNNGNIEGYMKGYWEHDSLVFIGKNGPVHGYRQTLARYKKSYPDKTAMGKLTSTILNIRRLSGEYYFVTGRWELERKDGNLGGAYTLLLQKIKGTWVIINDHSS